MQPIPGINVARALILAGLERDAVIRGLKVELDLTHEQAEAAWAAANERLNGAGGTRR